MIICESTSMTVTGPYFLHWPYSLQRVSNSVLPLNLFQNNYTPLNKINTEYIKIAVSQLGMMFEAPVFQPYYKLGVVTVYNQLTSLISSNFLHGPDISKWSVPENLQTKCSVLPKQGWRICVLLLYTERERFYHLHSFVLFTHLTGHHCSNICPHITSPNLHQK